MMSSSRSYIFRALYDWIVDNKHQPYVLVDATRKGVSVPESYVENGHIILNMSPDSIHGLQIEHREIRFQASFSGVVYMICLPIKAVLGIFSHETGQGLRFDEVAFPGEENNANDHEADDDRGKEDSQEGQGGSQGSSHTFLKIVD